MSHLCLYLFGAPRVEVDGQAVSSDRRKAIALLSYLAVTGDFHTRDALAALFWPDSDQSSAYAYLRRTLWEVNNALGGEWLEIERDQVRLNPAADAWVDVAAFSQLLAVCTPGTPAADCVPALREAVALVHGDFMAGFSLRDSPEFDDWQRFQAEALRRELAGALAKLVDGLRDSGEIETAVAYAQRWLTLDSLHEPAHRALMRLYAEMGRRADAIRQYEACVQLLDEELGIVPEAETTALAERIRAGAVQPRKAAPDEPLPDASRVRPKAAPRRNLPAPPTAFVGREAELAEIGRLLNEPDCRLLTLIGPGGIGKTRLAIQAAAMNTADGAGFRDGVYFVPLAPLSAPSQAVSALGRVVDFSFPAEGDVPRQKLIEYFRGRHLLLLMDNVEHLLPDLHAGDTALTELIAELLLSAPAVKVLATSRVRLNVQGEHLLTVTGMEVPPVETAVSWQRPEDALPYSSIRLFVDSARRVQPHFDLAAANLLHVIRICQLVQGMPLAIELAAGWVELLTPAEIRAEIVQNLDFLETEMQDVPARQRSIRAVFDSSWNLLTPAEQDAFQRLALFQGSFTRQAAQAVSGASLRTLMALVNKSLVRREANGRYEIHELLRQYAAARLQANQTAWQEAQAQHSQYYIDLLVEQSQRMVGPQQKEAFDTIEADIDDVRAGWLWAVTHGQDDQRADTIARTIEGLLYFYMARALRKDLALLLEKAVAAMETAVETPQSQLTRARLLAVYGWSLTYDHISTRPQELAKEALAIAQSVDAEQEMGVLLPVMASLIAWRGDWDLAMAILQRSVTWLRQDNETRGLVHALVILADMMVGMGHFDEGKQYLLESIQLCQQMGDRFALGQNLMTLGWVAVREGNYDEASRIFQESQAIFSDIGNRSSVAVSLVSLADSSDSAGDYERAARYYRAARHIYAEMGDRHMEASMYSWESLSNSHLGEYARARDLRQRSLALSQEIQDLNGIAWSYWELGELDRIEGHFAAAQAHYDEAMKLFAAYPVWAGDAFYYKGMAEITLARGDNAAAQAHFQEMLQRAQAGFQAWAEAYACIGLGRAGVQLNELETAVSHLRRGLHKAVDQANRGLILLAIAGLAEWFHAVDRPARAIELATFVMRHAATWQELRQRLAARRQNWTGALAPATVTEIEEKVGAWQFDTLIANLLEEFAEQL